MSATGVSLLKEATRVEVFRVAPEPVIDASSDTIENYPVLSTGKEQGQAFAKRLAGDIARNGVTRNARSVALSRALHTGSGMEIRRSMYWSASIAMCFGPRRRGARTQHIPTGSGRIATHCADLLALTKEAFPDDPEIQSLNAKRFR